LDNGHGALSTGWFDIVNAAWQHSSKQEMMVAVTITCMLTLKDNTRLSFLLHGGAYM